MNLPKPSQLNGNLMGSPLGKSEHEQIALNLRIIAKKNGDTWNPFTWDDYVQGCTHQPTQQEAGVLSVLVEKGYLSLDGETYHFEDKMIGMYMMMSKTEAPA